jgi:hypothetical protein
MESLFQESANPQLFMNNAPANNSLPPIVINEYNDNNRINENLMRIRELLISRQNDIMIKLNSYCDLISKDLNLFGLCVIDNFLDNGLEILSEVHTLYQLDLFRAGQLVNKKSMDSQFIRGDRN